MTRITLRLRQALACLLSGGFILLVGECIYSEWHGARGYLLGDLRDNNLLTDRVSDFWCRAEEDSLRTAGVATFTSSAEGLHRIQDDATDWLGAPTCGLGPETRSIVERATLKFRLPASISPLPQSEPESLLVFRDARPWLFAHLVILSPDRRRVWYFRYTPRD